MEENKEAYNSIDRDTREVLEVVAKVKIPEEYKVMKDGEERFEMCKAFEDYKLEGKLEQLVELICKKLLKNKLAETIADELEQDLAEIERVIAAQKKVGSYDVEKICKALGEIR